MEAPISSFRVGQKRVDNVGDVWTVVKIWSDPDDEMLGLVTFERRTWGGTIERMPLPVGLAESMKVVG